MSTQNTILKDTLVIAFRLAIDSHKEWLKGTGVQLDDSEPTFCDLLEENLRRLQNGEKLIIVE